ncbi:MAG: hypothetical protein JXR96_03925 [Deltaproteobacteria bacterium]|nr:hypothetical protein [Deltaproteobacteria bacterium]
METSRCPVCGAESIFQHKEGVLEYAKYVRVRGVGKTAKRVQRRTLLCTRCGHYWHLILDRKVLDRVEKKWKRAAPEQVAREPLAGAPDDGSD